MADVFLSLGANEGDREAKIMMAIEFLKNTRGIIIAAISSLYETEALSDSDQPNYINCVVRVETDLDPHSLLKETQSIEAMLGRKPDSHMMPRPIDIDILLYDRADVHSMDLMIPHSRLKQRRFVLVPLLEIEPDAIDPVTKKPLKAFLKQTESQKVKKIKDKKEVWDA